MSWSWVNKSKLNPRFFKDEINLPEIFSFKSIENLIFLGDTDRRKLSEKSELAMIPHALSWQKLKIFCSSKWRSALIFIVDLGKKLWSGMKSGTTSKVLTLERCPEKNSSSKGFTKFKLIFLETASAIKFGFILFNVDLDSILKWLGLSNPQKNRELSFEKRVTRGTFCWCNRCDMYPDKPQ